jgi:tetratricopeptide (TPR) repeat protein
LATAFDQANRFYEQGQFTNAAAAYERLIQSARGSATLYFNLGNAWFKAGQNGRALAAYRQAERLAPRDPSVRFNLQFVRKKVSGSETVPGPLWRRWLSALTLDEWTLLAMGAYWIWFLLLSLRESRTGLRKALRGYTATAGVAALLLAGCLIAANAQQSRAVEAVVIVSEAVVRYGPLEESQVFYQLRDGSEVTVLDEKQVSNGQTWLQVQDTLRRVGWLKRDQVLVLPARGKDFSPA